MPEIEESPKGVFEVLAGICGLKGGYAEPVPEGCLHTLLPPKEAVAAGLEEEMLLSLSAGTPGARYGGYGSETLEAFGRLLGEEGCFAEFALRPPHHLKSGGFDKLVPETLVPVNGVIKVVEVSPALTPYYLFNVAYTGRADEKRQGMVSFWMNGLTGAGPMDMGRALEWEGDRMEVEKEEGQSAPALDPSVLRAAMEAVAARRIREELDPWGKSLERRRKRDEDRVTGYFKGMAVEIRKRADKKGFAGEELAREQARARATELESNRKLADLLERYALQVKARLHAVLRVFLPTVQVRCELRRKQARRAMTAVYNPYSKRLEPLRCEQTHRAVTKFRLRDATVEILAVED